MLHMQHQPESSALDLSDGSHVTCQKLEPKQRHKKDAHHQQYYRAIFADVNDRWIFCVLVNKKLLKGT